MRDAFAVLFFVSVGMLFNPSALKEGWRLMLVTLGIVMLGKPLAALLVVVLLKQPWRLGFAISVALAQIGEFSFILASFAISMKIMPPEAMNALVVSSVISITLNPLLYKTVHPIVDWLEERKLVRSPQFIPPPSGGPFQKDASKDLVIVVGHGPVGRHAADPQPNGQTDSVYGVGGRNPDHYRRQIQHDGGSHQASQPDED